MIIRKRKYFFDNDDLQFKQVRCPLLIKLLRFFAGFLLSVGVAYFYIQIFEARFGSPKEKILLKEIDDIKLSYNFLNIRFAEAINFLELLKQSDDIRYRPVLGLDTISSSYRTTGYGGVDRFREYRNLRNSDILISSLQKIDQLKNMAKVQEESYKEIEEAKVEWIRQNEHLPKISPVDVTIKLGDGMKFRKEHPVLGTSRWHYGQDFVTPYGTEVFATGAGTVVAAGWNSEGFGNYVMIDHGYGFRTIYGHLSKIDVPVGLNVKRGDRIGLSGNSGTTSGPHLHYQIDYNGTHQNPLWYFSDNITPEEYRDMIMVLSSKSKFK